MDGDRTSWDAYVAFLSTPMDDGRPFVLETKHAVSLHFDHLATQSFMSLRDPNKLVLGYTRAMMGFLLIHPEPRHISMIGLGGGSLAKYCYRHLNGAAIAAIEISPDVIALRDMFRIPADDARFEVICADGAEYVRGASAGSDVILLDAFDAGGIPRQCASTEFFAACRERLTDAGVLVVNFANDDPALPDHLERLESVFGSSYAVLLVGDGGNYVGFAWKGARPLPSRRTLYERARSSGLADDLGLCATARRMKDGERFDRRRLVWHADGQAHWKIAV